MSQEDLFHLSAIEITFDHYFRNIDKTETLLQQGKTPQEIDTFVRVDDTPALQAISYFNKGMAGKNATLWWENSSARIGLIKKVSDQIKVDMLKQSVINIRSAKHTFWVFFLATMASLIISILLGTLLARRLVTELENISSNMKKMFKEHRFDQLLRVSGSDEISIMARTFNKLMSEHQKFETELRLSAEVFANISEAIMIANASKQIKIINPAFFRVTGYSEENVIGKNFSFFE